MWHVKLSTWMEEHEYMPVNNDKTIFMKWDCDDFILIRTFLDDFALVPTTQKLKDEFKRLYAKDFDFTGGEAGSIQYTRGSPSDEPAPPSAMVPLMRRIAQAAPP